MCDPMEEDSDFYGDEDIISSLDARDAAFNPSTSPRSYGLIPQLPQPSPTSTTHLHNRLEGHPHAKQLSETVDDFLNRLPPSRTPWIKLAREGVEICDWIWICNPYIPASSSEATDFDVRIFTKAGKERLALLQEFIDTAQAVRGRPSHIQSREINKERDLAVKQILDLARSRGVTSGKWMLFPSPGQVDEVWRVVAEYTAKGQLGTMAKVGTKDPDKPEDRRLICVYTRDFDDKGDIAWVLVRMKELGLVKVRGRAYYKCDAYTHLGIEYGNEWGIERASMYTSTEIFNYLKNGTK